MRSSKTTRPVVGLDIQPGSVHAVQVAVEGGLRVARAASAPLEPHVVRDGEVADVDALAATLRELFAAHKLGKQVRVGLANQRLVVRTLDVPPLEDRAQLEAAVAFVAEEQLPMPLTEAVIDFHQLGIVDAGEGPRQRVLLVAVRRQTVERIAAAVRAAGLRPVGIDLSAFALLRALGSDEAPPTLYLAVGGLTNVAIAHEGVVQFTRVSGAGVEGTAQMLAERRAMPLEDARLELARVGLAGELEPGAEEEGLAVRSVLVEGVRRVAAEARASLDFHQGSRGDAPPVERVVLTGAAADVPGFAAALEEELGLVAVDGRVAGTDGATAEDGRWSIAAGLAVEEAVR